MSKNFNIDFGREERLGFPEVVFAGTKDVPSLINIIGRFKDEGKSVQLTHLQTEKQLQLREVYGDIFYDQASKLAIVGKFETPDTPPIVGILSGGTSDEPVVNEAFYTLQHMGISAQRYQDVGVAGLHRFTMHLEEISTLKILIVVAGFEGALASVVGGLLPQPVIAVPTSVGYGVAHGGHTALHAMLASCANGITVVNIDNGYGAAMAAVRMVRNFNIT